MKTYGDFKRLDQFVKATISNFDQETHSKLPALPLKVSQGLQQEDLKQNLSSYISALC